MAKVKFICPVCGKPPVPGIKMSDSGHALPARICATCIPARRRQLMSESQREQHRKASADMVRRHYGLSENQMKVDFRRIIDDQRRASGLSIKALAKLSGVPQSSLSEWLGGVRPTINSAHLERLMAALKLTVE